MPSLNTVVIAGNITREPEVRHCNGGSTVCTLSVAINRKYKNGNGEYVDDVTFVDVECWHGQAEFIEKYLHKGDPVLVQGYLKQDSWQDNITGQKRTKLKIGCSSIQGLKSRQDAAQQPSQSNYRQQPAAPQAPPPPFPVDKSQQPGYASEVNDAFDAQADDYENITDIPFN